MQDRGVVRCAGVKQSESARSVCRIAARIQPAPAKILRCLTIRLKVRGPWRAYRGNTRDPTCALKRSD